MKEKLEMQWTMDDLIEVVVMVVQQHEHATDSVSFISLGKGSGEKVDFDLMLSIDAGLVDSAKVVDDILRAHVLDAPVVHAAFKRLDPIIVVSVAFRRGERKKFLGE